MISENSGGLFPASIFRALPIWLWAILLLGFAIAVPFLPQMGIKNIPIMYAGISAGVFVLVFIAYIVGGSQASALAKEIAGNLAKSRWLMGACLDKAKAANQHEQVRLRNETADAIAAMNQKWKQSVKDAIELRGTRPVKVDEKARHAFREKRSHSRPAHARSRTRPHPNPRAVALRHGRGSEGNVRHASHENEPARVGI